MADWLGGMANTTKKQSSNGDWLFNISRDQAMKLALEAEEKKRRREEIKAQYSKMVQGFKDEKKGVVFNNPKEMATSLIPFIGPILAQKSREERINKIQQDPLAGMNLDNFKDMDFKDVVSAKQQAEYEKEASKSGGRKVLDFFTSGIQDYSKNIGKATDSIVYSKALESSDLAKKVDKLNEEATILNRQKNMTKLKRRSKKLRT